VYHVSASIIIIIPVTIPINNFIRPIILINNFILIILTILIILINPCTGVWAGVGWGVGW
jgi:hypothetical protein